MDVKNLIFIILSGVFVNNYVLQRFLGICPFLGVSKKLDQATGMSIAVIFVMVLATAVTWPIQTYLLDPNDLGYLQTIVFILVIAALVQLVEIVLKRYVPSLHKGLGIYLPLITTNCAVLGVTVLNISEQYGFWQSMANSFGSGLGFFLAMVLFSGVRSRIAQSRPPKSFEGLPITLISAAIVSAAFYGFAGVVETLFQ
jgi:electron transport complex protein RnfA